ncbi:MAG: cytochrome c [Halieaceae bacterium]|nr:cytochrome c [Halieaceae bacterium]
MRLIKTLSAAALTATLSTAAIAHQVKEEPNQSYRQSYFALIGANAGPLFGMAQGKIDYDQKQAATHIGNLQALSSIDVTSAFPAGSDKGTTRAKPEIWSNKDDFGNKFAKMQDAINALSADTKGISNLGGLGQSCKACHDDYKAKDYLY